MKKLLYCRFEVNYTPLETIQQSFTSYKFSEMNSLDMRSKRRKYVRIVFCSIFFKNLFAFDTFFQIV